MSRAGISVPLLILLITGGIVLPAAHADLISFDSAESLLQVTSFTTGLEDFEETNLVGTTISGGVGELNFHDFSVTASPTALKVLSGEVHGNHNTTIDGDQYLSTDTDRAFLGSTLTLTFYDPIQVFGATLIDLDGIGGTGVIKVDGRIFNIGENSDSGESFFGIIADIPFTTVVFQMGMDSHWSLDDIMYDWDLQPIPEPASLLILGAGIAGIVLGRRRFA